MNAAFAAVRAVLPAARIRRPSSSFLFLTVLTVTTLFTWQHAHRATLSNGRAALALKVIAADDLAPVPSVAEQERALSPKQLLHRWDPLIAEAAKRFDLPASWIRAVMSVESGGRTVLDDDLPITSRVGAMGLMQVMPGTYNEMRAQYRLGRDAYAPRDNILAGAAYLSWLRGRYGFPGMFAAYNGGPGTYEDHLSTGRALPAETQNYVVRVANFLGVRQAPRVTTLLAKAGGSGGGHGDLIFTRPDGQTLSVAVAGVTSVRAPMPGEYAGGVNAVLRIGKKRQGVRETVANATSRLRALGSAV